MGKIVKNIVLILIGFLIISGIVAAFSRETKEQEVALSEIATAVREDKVKSVDISRETVKAEYKDDSTVRIATLGAGTEFTTFLIDSGVETEKIQNLNIEYKNDSTAASLAGAILPFLIPFVLIALFIYFLMRQVQGTNNRALTFGQSSVRLSDEKKNKVRFSDVAGAKEAKEELEEIVQFLKFPQKFLSLGAKIPKGVLLLGSPGVGKTLLARAVAGEANVPFFHISGSEFVEMFVGVGASRVRDLFKKAKKNAPCIVFIDEIDAVGRQRGTGVGGGHDEREQTLNQILVEMDGFETDTNIIVIAATNRPDVLDPALLRPGRFDRQVMLDLPDIKDREAILEVHSANKPMAAEVDFHKIAQRTPGFSGADLANVINEGAILAARTDKKQITNEDLKEAIEKVMMGPARKSHIFSDKEKKITAYHEGGHALVGAVLAESDPVHKVTILSRGQAGGYTLSLPNEDRHLHTQQSYLDQIAMALGGYAAEKLVFNELTTGASSDLKKATAWARKLVTQFGMSDAVGPVVLGEGHENVFLGRDIGEQKNYSESTAQKIDAEVRRILVDAEIRATELMTKHRTYLDTIADRLVKEETLEQDAFEEIVKDILPAGKKRVPEFEESPAEVGA
ncbi:MAG: ATP-dependent zinc metalloprotease FtsH [Candidatus Doudnabacteria bacterium]|nr:ATP-dependent zinc metalloprotease FtsH [Candidatus Doudnabacteria bacterium]